MDIVHVNGEKKGEIFLYTLSTCGWCRKMKTWLNERSLDYSYVDVDLVSPEEEAEVMGQVSHWNPRCNFPTVVVNRSVCLTGYQPEKLREILGL
jgi:glutaredoxin-like protein NrdH